MLNKELKLQSKLLNSITDSIFVHKLDGTFIYVNESAYGTRGYSKEELLGMKVKDLDAHDASVSEEALYGNVKNMKKSSITASFGVTIYNNKENRNDFIKRVDNALYKSKSNGRNKVIADIL